MLAWYETSHRKLPWRDTDNAYAIWVSEVMLQQTQVSRVLDFYPNFMVRFPTVADLAKADLQKVLKAWEKLGYYGRARNLHRAAKQVVLEFEGNIPADYSRFRKLPGVGEYIAAAVLSQAFGQPFPVVDGNVKRVLARFFMLDAPVNRSSSLKIFREKSALLLSRDQPGTFNQAMMELGATICRPRKPDCAQCPVVKYCLSQQNEKTVEYPKRLPSKKIPKYSISVGVIRKDNRVLITRRKNNGLLGGLWEFPGGKVKKGESGELACLREIREEINLQVKILQHLARVKHAYTHFKIEMDVFICQWIEGELRLNGAVDFRWIVPDEIDKFPFPGANHKFFPALRNYFLLETSGQI